VASTVSGGLTRVTIMAPKARVDLAMPSNVALANLVPTLLRYAGNDLADDGAAQGGWALSRLGGEILDNGRTAAQLAVRDGEILYLNPRGQAAPEMVFDDLVDAVAFATRNRSGRWGLTATRGFAAVFGALALLGGVLVDLFAGPPQLPAALVGLVLGLVLIAAAAILSRVGRDRRSSILFAVVALCYAGVGGLLLLAGDRPLSQLAAPHVLIAATAIVVYGAVCTLAVGTGGPIFVGATVSGAFLGLAAGVCLLFGVSASAAAAVLAAAVFGLIPALPMLSYRMARLPVPSIPTGPEDLKADTETVEGPFVLAASDRANGFLAGFLGTLAVVEVGAEIVLGLGGGVGGQLLCAVVALLLLLRVRSLPGRGQRVPLLVAGCVGLGVVGVASFTAAAPLVRLTVLPAALIVAAVVAIVYGFAIAGKRISPVWGRLLDAGEIILILAVMPLAAWVCGLYGWIRTIHS
jgi:type VII secretion integral membrane protein EccD